MVVLYIKYNPFSHVLLLLVHNNCEKRQEQTASLLVAIVNNMENGEDIERNQPNHCFFSTDYLIAHRQNFGFCIQELSVSSLLQSSCRRNAMWFQSVC